MLIDAHGELAMSYIGRYESLQTDLNAVLGHLGHPMQNLLNEMLPKTKNHPSPVLQPLLKS